MQPETVTFRFWNLLMIQIHVIELLSQCFAWYVLSKDYSTCDWAGTTPISFQDLLVMWNSLFISFTPKLVINQRMYNPDKLVSKSVQRKKKAWRFNTKSYMLAFLSQFELTIQCNGVTKRNTNRISSKSNSIMHFIFLSLHWLTRQKA